MRIPVPRHAALVAACAALAAAASGPALAAAPAPPKEVPFSPLDLAAGSIALPEGVALQGDTAQLSFVLNGVAGPPCAVVVADGALQQSGDGACPQLWAMAAPHRQQVRITPAGGAALDLILAPHSKSAPERLALAKGIVQLPASVSPDIAEFAVLRFEGDGQPHPAGWALVNVEDRHLPLDAPTAQAAARIGDGFHVFALGPDGDVLDWAVAAAGAPIGGRTGPEPVAGPSDPIGPGVPTDPGGVDTLQVLAPGTPIPPELACPPRHLPNPDMVVVCVDATGPQLSYHIYPEGVRATKPNRQFYVHIVHQAKHHPSVDFGGQIGSWVPGTRGRIDVKGDDQTLGIGGSQPEKITLIATSRIFAPRKPGFAPMVIKLFDEKRQQLNDPLAIEFWIDDTYSGAFRVGVAGIFLGGVEQRHHAVTHGNSLQPEIEVSARNLMDVDLMLGYSPYLDSGGRPSTGCEHAPFCFNPYFGIGIVSVDSAAGGGSLDWLKSIHVGVEWEISPAFAVALTANLRRVQRLAGGLQPGDPIEGDIPTESRYVFGVGLVVNLSPSFFKIGAGGPAALIQ